MSPKPHRPTPSTRAESGADTRMRRDATHDFWPRDFWDVAPDTDDSRETRITDWASI